MLVEARERRRLAAAHEDGGVGVGGEADVGGRGDGARGGHTMCDLDALLRRAGGSPTTSYAPFVKHFEAEVRASTCTPAASASASTAAADRFDSALARSSW